MSDALVDAALKVRENAHAPFSNFKVGAAVEDESGRIFTGCNVENATYGLTVCAERVAIFKAISEGARKFKRVAVVADTEVLTPPCGACRQILWEFCGDVELVMANLAGASETLRLGTLFPRAFDASFFAPDLPPLKPLHSGLISSKLVVFDRLTSEQILVSLRRGQPGCLKVRPDGTILDGHHRIEVLRNRGIQVDKLEREVIKKD